MADRSGTYDACYGAFNIYYLRSMSYSVAMIYGARGVAKRVGATRGRCQHGVVLCTSWAIVLGLGF